jgi:2,4-dienoyl-CoA reductase (NADPH2)
VATGVRPRSLDIPGITGPQVRSYAEAFADGALHGHVVIIGGGGIAVDVAHLASRCAGAANPRERFLREHGVAFPPAWAVGPIPGGDGRAAVAGSPAPAAETVTILQRGTRTGAGIGRSTRWVVLAELRRQGVEVVTGLRFERVEEAGVRVVDATGAVRLVPADTVVVAVGQQRDDAMASLVRRLGVPQRVVGGAREVVGLDAVRAFAEGLTAADELFG